MSGDGCGGDGGHCGGFHGDGANVGTALPFAERVIPRIAQLEINGAPVIEMAHEYVIRKKPRPDAQD